jgi:hypothetical protein
MQPARELHQSQQETTITKDTRKSMSAKVPLIWGIMVRIRSCVNAGSRQTSKY